MEVNSRDKGATRQTGDDIRHGLLYKLWRSHKSEIVADMSTTEYSFDSIHD
jgi:hypothetical protein